jgi:hypothetical protein
MDATEFMRQGITLTQGSHSIKFGDENTLYTFNIPEEGIYDIYFRPYGGSDHGWTEASGHIYYSLNPNTQSTYSLRSPNVYLRGKIASISSLD